MFALAMGMTMVLLTCAEGGYVKFVEFVTNKCLGYYGLNNGEKEEEKRVGWNDYVLHYLPRQSRVVAENNNSDKEIIVLDGKTMLFHQHSAKKKAARGKLEEAELVTDASVFAHSNFSHTVITFVYPHATLVSLSSFHAHTYKRRCHDGKG